MEQIHQLAARQCEDLQRKGEIEEELLQSTVKRMSMDLNSERHSPLFFSFCAFCCLTGCVACWAGAECLQERILKLRRALRQHKEILDKQSAKEVMAIETENEAVSVALFLLFLREKMDVLLKLLYVHFFHCRPC